MGFSSNLLNESAIIFYYMCLAMAIVGFFGSILMLCIYSQASVCKTSVSVYFRAMATSNLFMNICWLNTCFESYFEYILISQSNFICKTLSFLIYSISPMTGWFQAFASLDQWLKIIYSNRFCQMPFYPVSSVFLVVVYNLSVHSQLIFDYNLENFYDDWDNKTIFFCYNPNLEAYVYLDLASSILLPFVFMLVMSIAMIRAITKSRQRVRRQSTFIRNDRLSQVQTRDIRFSVTILSLNSTFLLMNSPLPVFNTLHIWNLITDEEAFIKIGIVFMYLYYSYFSVTFYIQMVVNRSFRKQFLTMIRRNWRKLTIWASELGRNWSP